MMSKFLTVFFYSFFTHSVFAVENCDALQPQGLSPQNIPAQAGCSCLKANNDETHSAYIFKQYAFEKGQDLVILEPTNSPHVEVRRVTFGRGNASTNCFFQPLAFTQGGEGEKFWGWHMLWAEPVGLYYVRMDGKAWVASNPKRLTKLVAINPQFKLNGQTIIVTWQQVENAVTSNMQALSSDEGRSWNIVPIP